MATRMKEVDVVIVGLGWTGGILSKELTEAGLKVVALERGAMRTTANDFAVPNIRDELRYVQRQDLMMDTARDTLTIRNNPSQEALPMRLVPARRWCRRLGRALERPHLALERYGVQGPLHVRGAIWQELHSRRHDDPGLGDHLRRAGAVLRSLRAHGGGVRQGRQYSRPDPARRQFLRVAAFGRISAASAHYDPLERVVRRGREQERLSSVPTADRECVARLHQSRRVEIRCLPILRVLRPFWLRSQCQG